MEPFISDAHRSSVQGYLCFSTRLIRHAFFQSVCMCVCLRLHGKPKSHCIHLWVLTILLTPCDDCQVFCPREKTHRDTLPGDHFLFCHGDLQILLYFFFSLDSFEVSLNKSTDKHIHVRDTHSNTPLILTHTTRAFRPFAFPTVYSCQAPWQPYGFFQWQ